MSAPNKLIPQLRSRTPEAPYCWQAKGALRRIMEYLDGDSILPFALTAYISLTLNASDKEAEEFTTLQSHLSRLAGGISTRTLQRALPLLREIGVIDYTTPRLRGPITFRLLSVATNSHNVATGKKTAFQADNKKNIRRTREERKKKAPPTPSCDAIASEGAHAGDSDSSQRQTGSNPSLNGDQGAGGEKAGTPPPAKKRRKKAAAPVFANMADAVVAAWNGADGLPQVRNVSEGRRCKLKTRLGDPFFREHYPEAIRRIATSGFCRGGGKNGWRATFDFLLKPDTVARTMEGAYDDRDQAAPESFL